MPAPGLQAQHLRKPTRTPLRRSQQSKVEEEEEQLTPTKRQRTLRIHA